MSWFTHLISDWNYRFQITDTLIDIESFAIFRFVVRSTYCIKIPQTKLYKAKQTIATSTYIS